ncbi:MAG TPA: hypothetical protein VFS43_27550 [Polyangiaceae bacterium]|nr:hypothetical protein [Polyangiaceae bacterium]
MFYQAIAAGGPGMIPTMVFGLILVGVAVRYATRPEPRLVPLLVSTGLMTLFSGALGFTAGVIKSCAAIGQVGPDERFVTVIGLGESLHNVALALTMCLLAAAAAAVGAARVRSVREA